MSDERKCDKCGTTEHPIMWSTIWKGKAAKLCGKCMYDEQYGKPLVENRDTYRFRE